MPYGHLDFEDVHETNIVVKNIIITVDIFIPCNKLPVRVYVHETV